MPSVNRIFPLRVLTSGAISLFLNITGAIASMAPVLNTPLDIKLNLNVCIEDPCTKLGITTYTMWYKQLGLANQDFWSLGAES